MSKEFRSLGVFAAFSRWSLYVSLAVGTVIGRVPSVYLLSWLMGTAVLLLPSVAQAQGLKDALGKSFLIGAALNTHQTSRDCDTAIVNTITRHFNSIVPENCLKPDGIQPREGHFTWQNADRFVEFGEQHGMTVTGHVLVWHAQTPDWFFKDSLGRQASKELLTERMRKHIHTLVGRYKGRIRGWDVVNEAINDDGTLRKSLWYQIMGPEFIEMAFRFAHEADPDAELYYNDYSLSSPAKRATVCRIVRQLKDKGLRIDAVGMQSHHGLDFPSLEEYERSIEAFAACGVKVMVTELDLNVLPYPDSFSGAGIDQDFTYDERMNPYRNGLPAEVEQRINQRWMDLFRIYKKHRQQISRVTLWGVSDAESWLNNWPVKGRTAYGLLFDRKYQAKPVVKEIIELFK